MAKNSVSVTVSFDTTFNDYDVPRLKEKMLKQMRKYIKDTVRSELGSIPCIDSGVEYSSGAVHRIMVDIEFK